MRKPSRRGFRKNAYGYLVKGIIFYPIEVGDPPAQVGSRTHFTLPVLGSYRSNVGFGVKSLDPPGISEGSAPQGCGIAIRSPLLYFPDVLGEFWRNSPRKAIERKI
ncbi:hypothetical protein AKJ61_01630 [candidate division MSBL1 archaeon SCGC-AAA259B11]|uniref:Uncharacterized protein n=1 Tax=candidate division MSBL1 archaeon SCGC-AAA259B11 TaxID=1698260 RepID=A0A133U752_9EURY|nr:hypothetical protein AKJ61_01630 [candidate division MSBL1 archaeon SCGC-AAA259B11]